LVSVVFSAGSSAVGVQLIQGLVNGALLMAGAALLALGVPRVRLLALMVAASSAGAELKLSWARGSGGEMALSMVATKVLRFEGGPSAAARQHGALLSLAITLAAGAAALGAGLMRGLPTRAVARRRRPAAAVDEALPKRACGS